MVTVSIYIQGSDLWPVKRSRAQAVEIRLAYSIQSRGRAARVEVGRNDPCPTPTLSVLSILLTDTSINLRGPVGVVRVFSVR